MDRIVVGVDGSKHSREALHWAYEAGRRHGSPVEAVFARAYPYAIPTVADLTDPVIELGRAEEYLEALLGQELGAPAGVEVAARVEEGVPAKVLIDASRDASLLVVGSRGRGGFAELLLGSVSLQCAQHAACPVAVVRPDAGGGAAQGGHRPRIVVGIDGSEASRAALRWAVAEARVWGATIDAVHTWHTPTNAGYPFITMQVRPDEFERSARHLLDGAIGAVDAAAVAVEPILVCGAAAPTLVSIAKGADLLVVGAHDGNFTGMLLGSVTNKVLHDASCPVVVVPNGN